MQSTMSMYNMLVLGDNVCPQEIMKNRWSQIESKSILELLAIYQLYNVH